MIVRLRAPRCDTAGRRLHSWSMAELRFVRRRSSRSWAGAWSTTRGRHVELHAAAALGRQGTVRVYGWNSLDVADFMMRGWAPPANCSAGTSQRVPLPIRHSRHLRPEPVHRLQQQRPLLTSRRPPRDRLHSDAGGPAASHALAAVTSPERTQRNLVLTGMSGL